MIFGITCAILIGATKVFVDMAAAGKPPQRSRPTAPPNPGWTYYPPGK